MKKHALIISPFAFFPANAGHRRRVLQTLDFFAEYDITFLLYAFEDEWHLSYLAEDVAAMRERAEVIVYKGRSDIGLPPANGKLHSLDEWYDDGFFGFIKNITEYRFFDTAIVHNVWMSKYLDIFNSATVKIIEAHDLFSSRAEAYLSRNIQPEFFMVSAKEEVIGLERADIVISIQSKEEDWIAENISKSTVTVPYYSADHSPVAATSGRTYRSEEKVRFGFVGSDHAFNVDGIKALAWELNKVVGETLAPVELLIAGTIYRSLRDLGAGCWDIVGPVLSEADFYESVDFVVAPVFSGTGFKVKVADMAAHGMPMLVSTHAAEGVNMPSDALFSSAKALADEMVHIAFARPDLDAYSEQSFAVHRDLVHRAKTGMEKLDHLINAHQLLVVIDMREVHPAWELVALAGLSTVFPSLQASMKLILWSESPRLLQFAKKMNINLSVESDTEWQHPNRTIIRIGPDIESTALSQMRAPEFETGPVGGTSGIPNVPLFGDSRNWNSFYHVVLKEVVRAAPLAGRLAIIAENDHDAVKFSRAFPETNFFSCLLSKPDELAGLAEALLAGHVTTVLDYTEGSSADRSLLQRIAQIAHASFICMRGEQSPVYGDLDFDRYWMEFAANAATLRGKRRGIPLKVIAGRPISLRTLSTTCPGAYAIEIDGGGNEMVWTSGLVPLSLELHHYGNDALKVSVIGLPFASTVGQNLVVSLDDKEKAHLLSDTQFQCIDFVFPAIAGDREAKETRNLTLTMPAPPRRNGADMTPAESDVRRPLSFLIYGLVVQTN